MSSTSPKSASSSFGVTVFTQRVKGRERERKVSAKNVPTTATKAKQFTHTHTHRYTHIKHSFREYIALATPAKWSERVLLLLLLPSW